MDDSPQPPGGFQKEIEQAAEMAEHRLPGPQFFPAPTAAESFPQSPDASAGDLFSRPHFMQGGWNVSADRTHWWNGSAWIPGQPPGQTPDNPLSSLPGPGTMSPMSALVGLIALLVFGAIAFGVCQSLPTGFGTGFSP